MKSDNNKHIFINLFWVLTYSLLLAACSMANSSRSNENKCHNCIDPQDNITQQFASDYICDDGHAYAGRVIGDGHCVSLIKHCSQAPDTQWWRPGQKVWQHNIVAGSIIATFKNNDYPNVTGYHAAVYIRQDSEGIWVWDQWQGKAVHQRLIKWRNDNAPAANTAQSYRLVKAAE